MELTKKQDEGPSQPSRLRMEALDAHMDQSGLPKRTRDSESGAAWAMVGPKLVPLREAARQVLPATEWSKLVAEEDS